MGSHFFSKDKKFWGFSLSYDGKLKDKISSVDGKVVKKVIDYSFEHNIEINFLPNIDLPCIFIKTPNAIWHYLNSQEEAEDFPKNIRITKNYPCCQFV